jgi:hypothetical protein
MRNKRSALESGKAFFKHLNCADIECARRKNTTELIDSQLKAARDVNRSEPLIGFMRK